jgi:O-antigen ligase
LDPARAGVASLFGRSETWSGRNVVWEAALEKFDKSVIFGHGFGQDIVTIANGSSLSSHNGYLGMLITWGVFAIFVVLPLFFIALYRSLSLSPWLFASIIFFLIVNLGSSEWSPASVTGFFFFSCIFFVLGSTPKGVTQLSTGGSRSALSER